MQQIAAWLEKLGMSEYAQRFAENRIDLSVLPDLTDQHLKDLGIALGDRLKMISPIRHFAEETVILADQVLELRMRCELIHALGNRKAPTPTRVWKTSAARRKWPMTSEVTPSRGPGVTPSRRARQRGLPSARAPRATARSRRVINYRGVTWPCQSVN